MLLTRQFTMLPSYRNSHLSRLLVQFAIVVGIGVVIPAAIYVALSPADWMQSSTRSSIGFSTLAALLVLVLIRRVGAFYNASMIALIVPALLTAYAIAVSPILVFRLPYSSTMLIIGAVGTLFSAYALHHVLRRQVTHHLVIPGGRSGRYQSAAGDRLLVLSEADREDILAQPPQSAIIVADLHYDHDPEWEMFMARAALIGMPVFHYKQVWEASSGQVRLEHLSENSYGTLTPNGSYFMAKRLFDIGLALVLLPILLIGIAVLGVLIKLDSPGPVFFYQTRLGFRGRRFRMVKFRTMVNRRTGQSDSARRQDAMTGDNDMRVTRLGKILRKTRMDEWPQLFNVLAGSMSWVGPRPEAIDLHHWYQEEIAFYTYRYVVRPGITGWAQVNQGHVTDLTSVEEKLRYDFYYIKNFSWWLDMLICIKTIGVILRGFGAR